MRCVSRGEPLQSCFRCLSLVRRRRRRSIVVSHARSLMAYASCTVYSVCVLCELQKQPWWPAHQSVLALPRLPEQSVRLCVSSTLWSQMLTCLDPSFVWAKQGFKIGKSRVHTTSTIRSRPIELNTGGAQSEQTDGQTDKRAAFRPPICKPNPIFFLYLAQDISSLPTPNQTLFAILCTEFCVFVCVCVGLVGLCVSECVRQSQSECSALAEL